MACAISARDSYGAQPFSAVQDWSQDGEELMKEASTLLDFQYSSRFDELLPVIPALILPYKHEAASYLRGWTVSADDTLQSAN